MSGEELQWLLFCLIIDNSSLYPKVLKINLIKSSKTPQYSQDGVFFLKYSVTVLLWVDKFVGNRGVDLDLYIALYKRSTTRCVAVTLINNIYTQGYPQAQIVVANQ